MPYRTQPDNLLLHKLLVDDAAEGVARIRSMDEDKSRKFPGQMASGDMAKFR